jgi:hypothetical protein
VGALHGDLRLLPKYRRVRDSERLITELKHGSSSQRHEGRALSVVTPSMPSRSGGTLAVPITPQERAGQK